MKDSKGKGGTRDRMQAIFNKNTKLSNSVNDVEQAFKPVIRDMFALYEFYQQVCSNFPIPSASYLTS